MLVKSDPQGEEEEEERGPQREVVKKIWSPKAVLPRFYSIYFFSLPQYDQFDASNATARKKTTTYHTKNGIFLLIDT